MGRTIADDDLARLGGRHAALLALAIWGVAECAALLPDLMRGQLGPRGILAYLLVHASAGLVLDLGLFRLIDRGRAPPVVAVATGLALLVHTLASALLYRAWFEPSRTAGEHEGLGVLEMLLLTQGMAVTPAHLIFVAGASLIVRNAELQRREQMLVASQAAADEARLSALRLQVNPHFLFNVLNTVTSLIESGRSSEANTVVARLAEFFRESMTTVSRNLIPLADELDIVAAYLDIEAVRYGERLAVFIDAADDLRQALVPHLLLQPLVENAVKYGVGPSKRCVTIRLRALVEGDRLVIRVSDNGEAGKTSDQAGGGVGLANVRSRLKAIYGAAGELRAGPGPGGFVAEVRLPLQRDQNSVAAA